MPNTRVIPAIISYSDSLFDAIETIIRVKTTEGRRTGTLIAIDDGEFFKYRALHRLVQMRIEAASTFQYGLHDFR